MKYDILVDGVVPGLIVPGTTIGVSLIPGYVEIRDKGLVKKKIPTKHRSFHAVLEEVEMYFRSRRKMLPPSTLKDVLVRIGLPEAKKIVAEDEPAKRDEEEAQGFVSIASLSVASAEPKECADDQEQVEKIPEGVIDSIEKTSAAEVLSSRDFQSIEEALTAVESMSDSFMAPQAIVQNSETKLRGVKISLSSTPEVISASSSFASAPKFPAVNSTPNGSAIDSETDIRNTEEEESEVAVEEDITTNQEQSITEANEELSHVETHLDAHPEQQIEDIKPDIDWSIMQLEKKSSTHIVKPLISSKILILGEEGVGKSSLCSKAGLELTDMVGELAEKEPFVQSKVFETDNHRVKTEVWSFDDAVQSKVSRNDFYVDAEVLIIVYSASDRWSFESIDFWLKEATIRQERIPPIVIVGNKMDLVKESTEDSGDEPVTNDEGFALAEELAKRFGTDDKLHSVAYIGTSCLTEEGVTDVFRTAAQLAAALRE